MTSNARQLSFDFYPRRAPFCIVPHADPDAPRRKRLEARGARLRGSVTLLKTELDRLSREADEVVRHAAAVIDPLRERMQVALNNALGWFETLLGPDSELGPIEKRAVSRLFEEVSQTLLDKLDELPDLREQPAAKQAKSKRLGVEEGSLGALFKQLAVAFHPDRATDEPDRARRHLVMREVTEAYAQHDVARLLELQERHKGPAAMSDLGVTPRGRLARLAANNRELERQRRRLERRVLASRRRPWGNLNRAGEFVPSTELQRVIEQSERVIESLVHVETLLRDFANGELRITALLGGLG